MKTFRGQPENWVWKPTPREVARLWVGFALMFYFLAAQQFYWPGNPQTTGRWGWLHRLALDAFGPSGEFILYALVGSICLAYGVWKYVAAIRVR